MYAWIRDLLVAGLGVTRDVITTDSSVHGITGIPDLTIFADTGVFDQHRKPLRVPRCVIEVKAEPTFKDRGSRRRVFAGKRKYIGPFTDWFLMIDTECIVARPVSFAESTNDSNDIVGLWSDLASLSDFMETFRVLRVSSNAPLSSLHKFRSGDTSELSVIKLADTGGLHALPYRDARKLFNATLADVTRLLQNAVINIVEAQRTNIVTIETRYRALKEKYPAVELSFAPIHARCDPLAVIDVHACNQDLRDFNALVDANPVAADLALRWLPNFYEHIGVDVAGGSNADQVSDEKQAKMRVRFATETANLLVARILLIRFFEDHGIFGEKKYICNGGVAAFQSVFEYFDGEGYETLLKHAFEKAATVYPMAFDSYGNWLFESHDQLLSRMLELGMMSLSRFDFATISGDILNGIYDRFLDKAQRKQFGEYYTPSTIARYMLERAQFVRDGSIFDPACGTGTFLIEAYEMLVGQDVSKGRVSGSQIIGTLDRLGGNDLNPFASVLAQIQMLWHLLPYRKLLPEARLSPIRITGQMNSLTVATLDNQGSLFSELNEGGHALVVANPPYVRPERKDLELDKPSQVYFKPIGGIQKNLYTLFLYRALRTWCKEEDGKVAFIIPLSFCDNDSNAGLRKLFGVGGEFRIIELVDLEYLAPMIFDASVNPLILIADHHTASEGDTVVVRVADSACITDEESRAFDVHKASEARFDYTSIWARDGRILTKLTDRRQEVLANYFTSTQCLGDIAKRFWVGLEGSEIVEWSTDEASLTPGLTGREGTMLRMGAAFRRQQREAQSEEKAFDFYKGENISTCVIEGQPVATHIDIDTISDASLWRFRDIMPDNAFAFARITLGLTSVRFDPRRIAFLNTATIFVPQDDLSGFPFDLLMYSNIYQWLFGTTIRMSPVTQWYSHVYPSNLAQLPWHSGLVQYSSEIAALRKPFVDACMRSGKDRSVALHNALDGVLARRPRRSLGAVCRDEDVAIEWPESLANESAHVLVDARGGSGLAVTAASRTAAFGNDLFSEIYFDSEDVAQRCRVGLLFQEGQSLTRDQLLDIPIPEQGDIDAWIATYEASSAAKAGKELYDIKLQLDEWVARAFRITPEHRVFIQDEMANDSYLRNIKPKLPYSGVVQRGLSMSLQSAERYR